jgi:hypothetical protein
LQKDINPRRKSISKKEGLKLIKTLEQFEFTGWEDKEDVKSFYENLMTSKKKNKKAKNIMVSKSSRSKSKKTSIKKHQIK